MRAPTLRGWWSALAALAAIRVGVPLVQLAGGGLPGLPRVHGHALVGDATGLYAGGREAIAAWARLPRPALALLAVATLAVTLLLAREARARPARRPWLVLAAIWWLGLLAAVNAAEQEFSGAGAAGWPLLWALAMLPLRVAGALDQNSAFWAGLPLALACNVATVIATAFAGLYATGRRSVGLLAGVLFALWPFLTALVAGRSAWGNSTWEIDAGLHMYTEPVSTALVAVALACLLSPLATPLRVVTAGAALGYATTVKLPAALLAVAGTALLAWRFRAEPRRLALFLAGGLAFVPLLALYWPLGYSELSSLPGQPHVAVWSFDFATRAWTDSLLFSPRALAILVPLAAIGVAFVADAWRSAALVAWTLACPLLYTFFRYTADHPRYLFVSLPSLFVLWAAAAHGVVRYALTASVRGHAPFRSRSARPGA